MTNKYQTSKKKTFFLFRKHLKKRKLIVNLCVCLCITAILHASCCKRVISMASAIFVHANMICIRASDRMDSIFSNLCYFFEKDVNKILMISHEKNMKLSEQIKLLQGTEKENQELRELLSLSKREPHKIILASIVSMFTNDFSRACIIDLGKSNGIAIDDIVKAPEGIIGRIIEVGDSWAKVLLITDMNSNIPTKIGDQSVNAIIGGNNSSTLQISAICDELSVQVGDTVVTSGYGNIFPENIPVGIVDKSTTGKLIVKTSVNFNKLKYVMIIK